MLIFVEHGKVVWMGVEIFETRDVVLRGLGYGASELDQNKKKTWSHDTQMPTAPLAIPKVYIALNDRIQFFSPSGLTRYRS